MFLYRPSPSVEDHRSRSQWPYSALITQSVKTYPIIQTVPDRPFPAADQWPKPMNRGVIQWLDSVKHIDNAGNQIYLHIPFCPFICHFCPLYKVKDSKLNNAEVKAAFVESLIQEIRMYAQQPDVAGKTFNCIYFGGGTPTELPATDIVRILAALRRHLRVTEDAEITLEGVARQMTPEYLDICVAAGFNRISFGVQSLDPQVRRKIGRSDAWDTYERVIRYVQDRHPQVATNMEIMVGLPFQTEESVAEDMRQIIAWQTDSLDVLNYVQMPGTILFEKSNRNQDYDPASAHALLNFRKIVHQRLSEAGYAMLTGEVYVREERDLFTRTGFGGFGHTINTILALGPSSFGLLNGHVYQNVCDLTQYMNGIGKGQFPVTKSKELTRKSARRRAQFLNILGLQIPHDFFDDAASRRLLRTWEDNYLVARDSQGSWRFTDRGVLWYNHMQLDFLSIREKIVGLRLIGSLDRLIKVLRRGQEGGSANAEIVKIITGTGFLAKIRVKLLLIPLLINKKLGLVDKRAIGFTGLVGDRELT